MDKVIYVLKKLLYISGTVLALLLTFLATVICFSINWMFDTWSNLSMDELMYHLKAPLEGTNVGMIKEYLNVYSSCCVSVNICWYIINCVS